MATMDDHFYIKIYIVILPLRVEQNSFILRQRLESKRSAKLDCNFHRGGDVLEKSLPWGRGGMGEYSRKFYTGRFCPEDQTLTLLCTILTGNVSLSYTFDTFHIPTVETLFFSVDLFEIF